MCHMEGALLMTGGCLLLCRLCTMLLAELQPRSHARTLRQVPRGAHQSSIADLDCKRTGGTMSTFG